MGHVHLKVVDLERALRFYRDVLGFELTQRFGSSAAFLSAGGDHREVESSRNGCEATAGFQGGESAPGGRNW